MWYSKGLLSSGKIVVYFPIECQINPVILSKLDLFADKNLNQNKEVAGYFDHKGRVRAIKLRGQPSEGFIMPLYHFDYATDSNIIESLDCTELINKEFDTIDKKDEEMWICRKYVPAPARNSGTGPKSRTSFSNLLIENQFKFHKETPKLSANLHQLQPEDIISISYKLHGTSAVFANLLTKRKLSILERIAKWLGANIQTTEYSKIYSSRSVIKYIENNKNHDNSGYYNANIWGKAFEKVKHALLPGISIYAEIVGHISDTTYVQKGYDYGTLPGEFDVYVYRITCIGQDGHIHEFDWNNVKTYCEKYGLKHVPELYHGIAKNWFDNNTELVSSNIDNITPDFFLQSLKDAYLEKNCYMCKNDVPAEGIVVRRESRGFDSWKLKSFRFLERETKQLDAGEVDTETNELNEIT